MRFDFHLNYEGLRGLDWSPRYGADLEEIIDLILVLRIFICKIEIIALLSTCSPDVMTIKVEVLGAIEGRNINKNKCYIGGWFIIFKRQK